MRDEARVGSEDALHVGVHLARARSERRRERHGRQVRAAAAERRHVVGIGRDSWKPATSTIFPASSASLMRVARTSAIFALPWTVSVTMPACEPVSEIASWPRSWTAIAQSEFEIRSPTEMSMSYSRGWG